LQGKVLIIDDVISAGTSVRESVEIIRAQDATPTAVIIALDRQERSGNAINVGLQSATQEVTAMYGIPVFAIASLNDVLAYLSNAASTQDSDEFAQYYPQVNAYREKYGI
jgi:orotate phosphoribosyltransferase